MPNCNLTLTWSLSQCNIFILPLKYVDLKIEPCVWTVMNRRPKHAKRWISGQNIGS